MDVSFATAGAGGRGPRRARRRARARRPPVPEAIDREVARLKLASLGVEIDALTQAQREYLHSWPSGPLLVQVGVPDVDAAILRRGLCSRPGRGAHDDVLRGRRGVPAASVGPTTSPTRRWPTISGSTAPTPAASTSSSGWDGVTRGAARARERASARGGDDRARPPRARGTRAPASRIRADRRRVLVEITPDARRELARSSTGRSRSAGTRAARALHARGGRQLRAAAGLPPPAARTRRTPSACARAGGALRSARQPPRSARPARPRGRPPRACGRTGRRARCPSRSTARAPSAARRRAVVERGSAPRVAAGAVAVVEQSGENASRIPAGRRAASSSPCRATGPIPPRRRRVRIGDSRCHQYRSPAAAKHDVLEDVDAGVRERGVVEGRDVPEPHGADVGDDAERGVAERPGGPLDALDPARDAGAGSHFVRPSDQEDRGEVERPAGAGPCACERAARRGGRPARSARGTGTSSPARPRRRAPAARAARAALGARAAPARARRRRRSATSATITPGAKRPRCVDGHGTAIVTGACCSGARPARDGPRDDARADLPRPRSVALLALLVPAGAAWCAACARRWRRAAVRRLPARALPWLRGHRCPRCALPRHRARPARRAARPSTARGRRWPTRARRATSSRALKFRGALAGRGPDGGAHRRQPRADLRGVLGGPAGRARGRRPCRPTAAAAGARGFDPAALLAAALAARAGLPARRRCLRRARPRRAARSARAARSRRSAGRFEAVAAGGAAARARCSSTTSTPPARRSTPAPAR